MNEKDMIILNCFLAEHVMGWKRVGCLRDYCSGSFLTNNDGDVLAFDFPSRTWKPTSDPVATALVLEKCALRLEELSGGHDCVQIMHYAGSWLVSTYDGDEPSEEAETLPLAICKFAKVLFTSSDETPA